MPSESEWESRNAGGESCIVGAPAIGYTLEQPRFAAREACWEYIPGGGRWRIGFDGPPEERSVQSTRRSLSCAHVFGSGGA
jgi:hypothetical protein